jgi:SAM-dependent methyltransferase
MLVVATAPGTVLQHMYVRERLRGRPPGTFIEIGIGKGLLTKLLLDLGWRGIGLELNLDAVATATAVNAAACREQRLEICNADWLSFQPPGQADLVISSMVLEHLDDRSEQLYLAKCASALRDGGIGILIVPASPAHWGVEDNIVGHHRRYTFDTLHRTLNQAGFKVAHLVGLNFPLSNLLLPISNLLVGRHSRTTAHLPSKEQQTKASGMLQINWKTNFPSAARLLINSVTLYPFHLLQKLNRNNRRSLVLYAEFIRRSDRPRRSIASGGGENFTSGYG